MGGGDPATQNEFGKNCTALVVSNLLNQPQHGVFLDSCHHHCGNWDSSMIDGVLSGAALQTWYTKGAAALPNKGEALFDLNEVWSTPPHVPSRRHSPIC